MELLYTHAFLTGKHIFLETNDNPLQNKDYIVAKPESSLGCIVSIQAVTASFEVIV